MTPTVGRSRAVSFVLLMVRVSASCSIWPMTVPLGRHGCVSVNSDDSLSLVVEVRKNSKFTGLKFDRVYLLITFCSDQSFITDCLLPDRLMLSLPALTLRLWNGTGRERFQTSYQRSKPA